MTEISEERIERATDPEMAPDIVAFVCRGCSGANLQRADIGGDVEPERELVSLQKINPSH
jgi:hypothetical protein